MYSGEDGSIYLLDVRRTGSRKMEQERILKYDRNGKMVQVVLISGTMKTSASTRMRSTGSMDWMERSSGSSLPEMDFPL
ncbi:MAG: hypothetical protein ACLVBJ_02595 [Pilosibacter sp.]